MHSPELEEARRLFEQAEQDSDPERKFIALQEALDVTDDFKADHDAASLEVGYANNLRRAHLRRLIAQLVTFHHIEIEIWVNYIKLLLLRVEPEVKEITAEDPALHESHRKFVAIWMDELIAAIQKRGVGP